MSSDQGGGDSTEDSNSRVAEPVSLRVEQNQGVDDEKLDYSPLDEAQGVSLSHPPLLSSSTPPTHHVVEMPGSVPEQDEVGISQEKVDSPVRSLSLSLSSSPSSSAAQLPPPHAKPVEEEDTALFTGESVPKFFTYKEKKSNSDMLRRRTLQQQQQHVGQLTSGPSTPGQWTLQGGDERADKMTQVVLQDFLPTNLLAMQSLKKSNQHINFSVSRQDSGEIEGASGGLQKEKGARLTRKWKSAYNSNPFLMAHDLKNTNAAKLFQAQKEENAEVGLVEAVVEKRRLRRERDNVRSKKGKMALLWHDFKQWYKLWRKRRQDKVPIWAEHIRTIEGTFGTTITSFFVFIRYTFLLNITLSTLWFFFIILPQSIHFDYSQIESTFSLKDVFDGAGTVGEMWFFYGGYSPVLGPTQYQMDVWYLGIVLLTFIISYFMIVKSIGAAWNSRAKGASSQGSLVVSDTRYPFAMILFTSWDHSLHSGDGLRNLGSGITNTFRDMLSEDAAKVKERELDEALLQDKWKTLSVRAVMWTATVLISVGCFIAIFFAFQAVGVDSSQGIVSAYAVPSLISAINAFVPALLGFLVQFEKYTTGQKELQITIVRTYALRMVNIYVLMYGVYVKSETDTFKEENQCLLTSAGQEFYRLLVTDTVANVLGQFVLRYGKFYWSQEKSELNISQGVIVLVYRQALIWGGVTASPIMPIVGLGSIAVFFYSYYNILMMTACVPKKRWNQSRTNVFFHIALLITLSIIMCPVLIILTLLNPTCGLYEDPKYSSVFDALPEFVDSRGGAIKFIFTIIISPAFWLPILIIVAGSIYYLNLRLRLEISQGHDYMKLLEKERDDKNFLLKNLNLHDTQPVQQTLSASHTMLNEQ
eukprot:Nk52_evm15s2542 gene=Nk52_evmTU15s2542